MKNLKNTTEIEAYLQGNMSESDMIELEVRLLQDEKFRHEFQTMKILWQGIMTSAEKSSQQVKINRLTNSASPLKVLNNSKKGARILPITHNRKRVFYATAIALSITLIALIAIPILFPGDLNPQEMFAENFQVSPNLDYRSARGTVFDPAIIEAYRSYDQGDYQRAAQLLEDLVGSDEDRLTHQFYLGNCYLVLEKWDRAISALQEPAYANIQISDDAKWYLSLAYLASGDSENAVPLLKETSRMQDREKMARNMLRAIDN